MQAGGGDRTGKRKILGEDVDVECMPGKRNKNGEGNETGYNELAEAAM
jgi:hypothetical protein